MKDSRTPSQTQSIDRYLLVIVIFVFLLMIERINAVYVERASSYRQAILRTTENLLNGEKASTNPQFISDTFASWYEGGLITCYELSSSKLGNELKISVPNLVGCANHGSVETKEFTSAVSGLSWTVSFSPMDLLDSDNLFLSLFVLVVALFLLLLFVLRLQAKSRQLSLQVSTNSNQMKEMSEQLAHDIRSPLAALEMISNQIEILPLETRTILRNSIQRLRDIANALLTKKTKEHELFLEGPVTSKEFEGSEKPAHLLMPLLDSIVTEKRVEFRSQLDLEIDFSHTSELYGVFMVANPQDFQRMISNLINNAVESIKSKNGVVAVNVESYTSNFFRITIKDTGEGIPPEVLHSLGKRGRTVGKKEGTGLGLHHAITTCELSGGKLELTSEVGMGTKVSLTLPKVAPPAWFTDSILCVAPCKILVCDDDLSIHQIWQNRFLRSSAHTALVSFSSPSELKEYFKFRFHELENARFLIDYYFEGTEETGLDLIESLGIDSLSILVTSKYHLNDIQERCLKRGITIIPKEMLNLVPIIIQSPS